MVEMAQSDQLQPAGAERELIVTVDVVHPAVEFGERRPAALFPAHEIEQFTEYFWQKIQEWRQEQ